MVMLAIEYYIIVCVSLSVIVSASGSKIAAVSCAFNRCIVYFKFCYWPLRLYFVIHFVNCNFPSRFNYPLVPHFFDYFSILLFNLNVRHLKVNFIWYFHTNFHCCVGHISLSGLSEFSDTLRLPLNWSAPSPHPADVNTSKQIWNYVFTYGIGPLCFLALLHKEISWHIFWLFTNFRPVMQTPPHLRANVWAQSKLCLARLGVLSARPKERKT